MLDAIGVRSVDELFTSIPEKFRLREPLPSCLARFPKCEIIRYFQDRAAENARGYTSFLGAGVYQHLRSVVPDALIQRGEFLTSYTPYQAEFAQGTLTAIFEFQTLMCQLTGQEVANASMYDGSTALTEAVLMAERLTGSHTFWLRAPCIRNTARCCTPTRRISAWKWKRLATPSPGRSIASQLDQRKAAEAAAVVVQSPNFFGVLEEHAGAGRGRARRRRAAGYHDCRSGFARHCASRRPKRTSSRWKARRSGFRRATADRTSA